ncbi:MAG: hypothetical protein CVU56_16305 [Deltaproteobacteria bacterium HGW-Deltaproteobacteria-14]|jgi:hypothetical protein|nr:MAG: hypothetical protein CVU56_16305 [Deltaproteobacteria bacterium HGW-Deltaproteobacteria-14]
MRSARALSRIAVAVALGTASLLAPVASLAAGAAVDDARIREVTERVLSDPAYEKSLPEKVRRQAPDERPRAGRRVVRRASDTPREPVSSGSGMSQALLWTLLGALGVGLVLWLGREALRMRERRAARIAPVAAAKPVIDDAARAILDRMPATLRNARALADEGRFEEAVHLLLRGAIDDVGELARLVVEPAMTSRELLRQAELEPASREAFEDLVMSVEVSLFGGLAVSSLDFERCARSFEHLHGRLAAA